LSPWNAAKQGDLTSILGIHINYFCTRRGLTGSEETIRTLINRFRRGYGIEEGLSVMQFNQLSYHSVAFKDEMRTDVTSKLRNSMVPLDEWNHLIRLRLQLKIHKFMAYIATYDMLDNLPNQR
jgi:hypothetical protein